MKQLHEMMHQIQQSLNRPNIERDEQISIEGSHYSAEDRETDNFSNYSDIENPIAEFSPIPEENYNSIIPEQLQVDASNNKTLTYQSPSRAEPRVVNGVATIYYNGTMYHPSQGLKILTIKPNITFEVENPHNKTELHALIAASKVLTNSKSSNHTENKDIVHHMHSWFDEHLIGTTGCIPQPDHPPRISMGKLETKENAYKIESMSHSRQSKPAYHPFSIECPEEPFMSFLTAPRLDNKDLRLSGVMLGEAMGNMSNDDVNKDQYLRQSVLRKLQVKELLHISQKTIQTISRLSVSNSMHTFSEKLQQLTSLQQLIINIQTGDFDRELISSLKHRNHMRQKVLGKMQPFIIRNQLLESSYFSEGLFPKEITKESEKIAESNQLLFKPAYPRQIPKTNGRPFDKPSFTNPPTTSPKRQMHYADPTQRKKPRLEPYKQHITQTSLVKGNGPQNHRFRNYQQQATSSKGKPTSLSQQYKSRNIKPSNK
jgi:hypothetical protein